MHDLMGKNIAQKLLVLKIHSGGQINAGIHQPANHGRGNLIAGKHQYVSHFHAAQHGIDYLIILHQQTALELSGIAVFLPSKNPYYRRQTYRIDKKSQILPSGKNRKSALRRTLLHLYAHGRFHFILHDIAAVGEIPVVNCTSVYSSLFQMPLHIFRQGIPSNAFLKELLLPLKGIFRYYGQAQWTAQRKRHQQAHKHHSPKRRKHEAWQPILQQPPEHQNQNNHDASIQCHKVKRHIHPKMQHSISPPLSFLQALEPLPPTSPDFSKRMRKTARWNRRTFYRSAAPSRSGPPRHGSKEACT